MILSPGTRFTYRGRTFEVLAVELQLDIVTKRWVGLASVAALPGIQDLIPGAVPSGEPDSYQIPDYHLKDMAPEMEVLS